MQSKSSEEKKAEGKGGSKEGDEDEGSTEKNKSAENARPMNGGEITDDGLIMDARTNMETGSKEEGSKMTKDSGESGVPNSIFSIIY